MGNPARYRYDLSTVAGQPDMVLTLEGCGTVSVEAKRFGAIKELEQARRTIVEAVTPGQLALPGMATDRTMGNQRAINC